jgi:hypothetical protein
MPIVRMFYVRHGGEQDLALLVGFHEIADGNASVWFWLVERVQVYPALTDAARVHPFDKQKGIFRKRPAEIFLGFQIRILPSLGASFSASRHG